MQELQPKVLNKINLVKTDFLNKKCKLSSNSNNNSNRCRCLLLQKLFVTSS
jgi:hypothetical protein